MDEVTEMPVILPIATKDRAIQISGTIVGVDLFIFGFQYRPGQFYTAVTGGAFFKEQLASSEVMLIAEAPVVESPIITTGMPIDDANPQTETFVITN